MKKNIAIIIPSLKTGGAEKVAAMLSRYLSQRGHSVTLFLENPSRKGAFAYGGRIVALCSPRVSNPWIKMMYQARHLKGLKREYQIDCSISFMEESNFINILARQNDRVIISVRTYLSARLEEWGKKKSARYRFLIAALYNRADKIVALTQGVKQDLQGDFHCKGSKIRVIANPLDPDAAQRKSCADGLPQNPGEKKVVAIGRLEDVKAHWYLIRAMKEVVRAYPQSHLYILGKGYNAPVLSRLADSLGIAGHVHLDGFCENVYAFLSQAQCFVLSSKVEGFGNGMLDALSCGVPVISTDCCCGPREILAPGTQRPGKLDKPEYAEYGILVPAPDSGKDNFSLRLTPGENCLADAILKLLCDGKLRRHYALKACERAKAYEADAVFNEWEGLIRQANP